MKRSSFLLVIIMVVAFVLLPADLATQSSQSADVLLGAALHQEEVEGDYEAAIETYMKLLAEYPDNRRMAAQAQFRIGKCYEKLGRKEAQKAYKEVVDKYTDQPEFASKARDRLEVLKSSASAPPRDSRLTLRRVPRGNPSPDGKYLAYIDWDTGNVAVSNVVTGAIRHLSKDGSWGEIERYPENLVWSPESRRIAYTWNMGGLKEDFRSELRVVSPDGDSPPRTVIKDERYLWPWAWTPDGQRILCGLQVGGPIMDRALINVDTGAVETLNMPPGRLGSLYRFTPNGESILYSRPSDGKWNPDDIYLYELESGESRAIVEHPAEDLVAGILPGTDWLLFMSDRRGSFDLWGVPFCEGQTDGQPLLIKQGLQRFIPLSFTNDGSLYYATRTSTDDVFLADFDPVTQKILGEPRQLPSRWEGTTMDASFSPDGKSIAYVASRGSRSQTDSLVVQSLEDVDANPIVVDFRELHLEIVRKPSWAANGQSIVLGCGRRGEDGITRGFIRVDLPSLRKSDIYWPPVGNWLSHTELAGISDSVFFVGGEQSRPITVMQIGLDGRSEKEIFRAPEGQGIKGIALSPDEKTLSIVTDMSLKTPYLCSLLLLPLDGGLPRRIHEFMDYTGGRSLRHAWTPDGKSIFYTIKDKLDERSWSVQRISVAGGADPDIVYKRNDQTWGMAFHPNGRMFAFSGRSSNASEAWVMENLIEELKRKSETK
ncbi:tetratricopeptide repeat protein [Acidobacteriota bacterium]